MNEYPELSSQTPVFRPTKIFHPSGKNNLRSPAIWGSCSFTITNTTQIAPGQFWAFTYQDVCDTNYLEYPLALQVSLRASPPAAFQVLVLSEANFTLWKGGANVSCLNQHCDTIYDASWWDFSLGIHPDSTLNPTIVLVNKDPADTFSCTECTFDFDAPNCWQYHTCGGCSGQYTPECGWCPGRNSCLPGSVDGPAYTAGCPLGAWDYYGATCQGPIPAYIPPALYSLGALVLTEICLLAGCAWWSLRPCRRSCCCGRANVGDDDEGANHGGHHRTHHHRRKLPKQEDLLSSPLI
ncbi:hypothetical protein PAPYR_4810 [Paratrimastix pyriformis]|uniref:Uncharacterized protein n=1 Tax=Paratrimastix pyriformis TaxID=342808 RepID=A0ABQ8ULY2_9EUKA|nr:hypothetical protein PAPYR_4810 [Paratrimastix pyriformis]